MPKISGKEVSRRKAARRTRKLVTWVGVLAAVGGIGYLALNSAGVRYNEDAIAVVDFSSLNPTQKRTALVAANAAQCTCGCGLRLAECVATDSTCPIRADNIVRIRKLVEKARE
jgi:hypothetical protein